MIIQVPLPPKACHPNSRASWRSKAAAVKAYRAFVAGVGRAKIGRAKFKPMTRAVIQAHYTFATRRRRDGDNLLSWLKPAFDGLVDGGILADDHGLIHLPVQVAVGATPGVDLVITDGFTIPPSGTGDPVLTG